MTTLYPPITPYASGMMDTSGIHRIYWETSGNPDGIPVLFVHGGPGSGTSPRQRQFFDPARYRIVLFDQRGSGRSTPHGELTDNTTPHLIADMDALRCELGIDSWLVFGGSWGSTLALAYAEAHPERCRGLVLRGIFLCRTSEIDWFLDGIRAIFPEAQRQLAEFIPAAERGDLLTAYHQRLLNPDPAINQPAAHQWATFEASCSTLLPNPELVSAFCSDKTALSLSRIEAHYFVNNIFLPDNSLLARLDCIRAIPAIIVQGRYDAVCPIVSADELARAWPEARYVVVPDAGHSAFEPGIARELIAACDRFAKTGGFD
ncbi:MAG TPA: prolyl aminopeptidase [Thiobacillus sp.]|nr:MAG: prolyl aminopeptidase [Hydrogenophilales bacterium 28-61-11]OYZ56894.1 MAG: prolyl aminopeptidase [Hydrogenophilales bacterium 16-61-112]OZA47927.1 MAG: prolyl aminopeptidase [Hydrogenophilales bacterium 17-61-76]HQT30971.1 prolyl aminopeptidase [Thiobacillus sp.]HQT69070.1 prolyl aminopeptidase [Thiobacillus sp.]